MPARAAQAGGAVRAAGAGASGAQGHGPQRLPGRPVAVSGESSRVGVGWESGESGGSGRFG